MGTDVEYLAKKILHDAAKQFDVDSSTDRADACEAYLRKILLASDMFVSARIMKEVEALSRIVIGFQTMIGAPKKRAEGHEIKPMERMTRWLNGPTTTVMEEEPVDA